MTNAIVADDVPDAGAVREPFRYFQSTRLEPEYMPIQSRALPGPFATATVTLPPGVTDVGVTEIVGGIVLFWTVMGALVASTPNVSFTRNWTVYVPGVAGIEKLTVVDEAPVAGGTRVPFRYFQSMRLEPA